MFELIAIAAGIVGGLVVDRVVPDRRWVFPVLTIYALLVGFGVSFASGELELSLGFLIFDTGQVLVAAFAALLFVRFRRASSQRARPT